MSASAAKDVSVAATPDTVLFNGSVDGGNDTTHAVRCLSTSAAPVLVHVNGLHKTGEYARVPIGSIEYFRLENRGIGYIVAKGDGGTATIDHHSIAKTSAVGSGGRT